MEQQLEDLELKVVELRLMKAKTQLQLDMLNEKLKTRCFMMMYSTMVLMITIVGATIGGLLFF